LSLKPPLTVTAVTKSSSQILGSCYPLNLTMSSLILSPFGRGVVRMYKLKHSAPQSSSLLTTRTICSPSLWVLNRRASCCARAASIMCCVRPCQSLPLIGCMMWGLGATAGTAGWWHCTNVPSWCQVTGWVDRRLQHSNALESKSSKLRHMLIIIGRVGCNVCGSGHDCHVSNLG
jgi:hypothetical protein